MPRRNRNAWRNDAEKSRALDVAAPRPAKPTTRRERRRAQRAFNQERKAA